jgi:hypothetical protein
VDKNPAIHVAPRFRAHVPDPDRDGDEDSDVARVLAESGRAGSERFRASCQMLAVLLSSWITSPYAIVDPFAHALEALVSSTVGQAEVA